MNNNKDNKTVILPGYRAVHVKSGRFYSHPKGWTHNFQEATIYDWKDVLTAKPNSKVEFVWYDREPKQNLIDVSIPFGG